MTTAPLFALRTPPSPTARQLAGAGAIVLVLLVWWFCTRGAIPEERIISPAILMAREQGIDVHGPFPPDTIFMRAAQGAYDAVVAMYHDQGLIPVKLLAFDQAVNVTIGLPIIRTSPDHGTAFDIVGRNRANPGSMRSAIELAIDLAIKRRQHELSNKPTEVK